LVLLGKLVVRVGLRAMAGRAAMAVLGALGAAVRRTVLMETVVSVVQAGTLATAQRAVRGLMERILLTPQMPSREVRAARVARAVSVVMVAQPVSPAA
jgi:hypothetical protein